MSNPKSHWGAVYASKQPFEVSWYQPHLRLSLELIGRTDVTLQDAIIDVGSGPSTLVDDLLDQGFRNVAVLDISSEAIDIARSRLGNRAALVDWMVSDVLHAHLRRGAYRLWHDRAVFHFLTDQRDRRSYVAQVRHAVSPGGWVVISTFSPEGPRKCSGLDVCRYSSETLLGEFGRGFRLIESHREEHLTPSHVTQAFLSCLLAVEGRPGADQQ